MLKHKILGHLGEWLVKTMYISAGYKLLNQNQFFKNTEIDLVFSKNKNIYLVEVKLFTSTKSFTIESWQKRQSYKFKNIRQIYESNYPDFYILATLILLDFSKKDFISVKRFSF